MKNLYVIKIGGKVINDEGLLNRFLDDFSQIKNPKILVHGGGNVASNLCKRLGINVKINNGRRITDKDSLEVAVMVYAGLINKSIVAQLEARNCAALGVSGTDLNLIKAKKRSHPTIDYGFVGDVNEKSVNITAMKQLLDINITPVFCALTHDGNGQLLNTNADTLASLLARSLASHFDVSLTFCFEKEGVLGDVKDEHSLIPLLDKQQFTRLKNKGSIHEGMIPKLDNAFEALHRGVKKVSVKHPANLLTETGTQLTL